MERIYFNFQTVIAGTPRQRSEFFQHWWRLSASDRLSGRLRWTPQEYTRLRRLALSARQPHLKRLAPVYLHLEAASRPGEHRRGEPPAWTGAPLHLVYPWDDVIAAAGLGFDPRLPPATAVLIWPRAVNDAAVVERLLAAAQSYLSKLGIRRLLGPTGLSTHLESGLQLDGWHLAPASFTTGNPPFFPELILQHMSLLEPRSLSWEWRSPPEQPDLPPDLAAGPAQLQRFPPERLAGDLLPLLQSALPGGSGFPPPDREEASLLLEMLPPTSQAWLAQVGGTPAGFYLAAPEFGAWLRRTTGGRSWLQRFLLFYGLRRPTRSGRLLYLGVEPKFRGLGIGRQLLASLHLLAARRGWQTIAGGPWSADGAAAHLLPPFAAQVKAQYGLCSLEW